MFHDFRDYKTIVDDDKKKKIKEEMKENVKKYLNDLSGIEMPTVWFDDDQFEHLYEDLKNLIGSQSKCQGKDPGKATRVPTMGNLILLLLTAANRYSKDWINQIEWTKHIVNKKIVSDDMAKDQIKSLLLLLVDELFPKIVVKKYSENEALIKDIFYNNRGILQITLDFPCKIPKEDNKGRDSLFSKIQSLSEGGGGELYPAYREFLIQSSNTPRGRDTRCVMNFIEDKKNPDRTILEVRLCV